MRLIVIKSRADLQELRTRLGRAERGSGRTFEDIEKLNPHLDFKKIEPGTVVLVPDVPDTREPERGSIQGQPFDELRDDVMAALRATGARVRAGYQGLGEQAKEVSAVFKTAAFKRAVEADPALQPQVDAAAAVFKRDTAQAKAAEEMLKMMERQATEDLEALAKLLG
jgi:hypothetical protein